MSKSSKASKTKAKTDEQMSKQVGKIKAKTDEQINKSTNQQTDKQMVRSTSELLVQRNVIARNVRRHRRSRFYPEQVAEASLPFDGAKDPCRAWLKIRRACKFRRNCNGLGLVNTKSNCVSVRAWQHTGIWRKSDFVRLSESRGDKVNIQFFPADICQIEFLAINFVQPYRFA